MRLSKFDNGRVKVKGGLMPHSQILREDARVDQARVIVIALANDGEGRRSRWQATASSQCCRNVDKAANEMR